MTGPDKNLMKRDSRSGMSYRDILRPITSAQLMVQLAREHGVSIDQCLAGTGIASDILQNPAGEIRLDQEIELTRNVVIALKHVPALGLEAGLRYSLATFGIYGFAILSSSTIRAALDVAMRYHPLAPAFSRVYTMQTGPELRIVIGDEDTPPDLRTFSIERSLATQIRVWREVLGVAAPMPGLRLRMPRPAHAARLAEVCGVTPRYEAEDNSYVIEPAQLDRPIAFGNSLVAQQVERECKALLDRRRQRKGLAEKVRDIILHEPRRIPSLDAVATHLHMTTRTLRRHLLTESTSYRELVEEVRQGLAEELLTRGLLKMEEVAERLGYSDATSFSHAFRRWKGHAPRDLR
jgi:AraC-like DNA-binding protein